MGLQGKMHDPYINVCSLTVIQSSQAQISCLALLVILTFLLNLQSKV